jgi:hypothetical protein
MSPLAAQTISTSRLDLLPLHIEHAQEMATVLSDPVLHTFIGGTPQAPHALRSRYQRITAGSPDPAVSWLNWVIRLREESCLTGTLQITPALLAIGLYGSTHGIDLGHLRTDGRTLVLAVTGGCWLRPFSSPP